MALDHHVENGRADQAALIYDSPVTNTKKTYTFRELRDEVALCAGMLKDLGVVKGDRVIVYMPMIAEAAIARNEVRRLIQNNTDLPVVTYSFTYLNISFNSGIFTKKAIGSSS